MGNTCCIILEWDDFIEDESVLRHNKHRTSTARNNFGARSTKVAHHVIEEDPLLEDMCELAGIEANKGAERITVRDKKKLLNKLSNNQATEKYFRNEQAFSNFIDNQQNNQLLAATLQTTDRYTFPSNFDLRTAQRSRMSNMSRLSHAKPSMTSMGRGVSRVSVAASRTSISSQAGEKRVSAAYDLGYEIARKKQNGDDKKACCCFRAEVTEEVTSGRADVNDKSKRESFFKDNRKKPYGFEEFEKDLKMRRLKNRQ